MRSLLVAALLLCAHPAFAQSADSLMEGELDPIVVTATRTPHQLEEVPVPTTVIGQAEIDARGAVRLPDLLAEQPGLMLHYDHGTGIQMQGLGPEYTSILVDGVRLIGRTAGTLELNRVTLNNVERVEIIRGPSSSLYGSEALAGVINIITARPDSAIEGSLRARYGTHETADLSAYLGRRMGRTSANLFVNRHSSSGYDLDTGTVAPTGPAFADYTVQGRLQTRLDGGTMLVLAGRTNLQHQETPLTASIDGVETRLEDRSEQLDWSLSPSVSQRLGGSYLFTGRADLSRFTHVSESRRELSDELYVEADYAHVRAEGEAVVEGYPLSRHYIMMGAGYVDEAIDADRIDGNRHTVFAFAQDEWQATDRLDVVLSARFDAPNDYAARFSPKAAILYRFGDAWRARFSAGSGYKAPDFRQLYLDFTNPTVGYSVIGSTNIEAGLARLQREGQVADVLMPNLQSGALEAESSIAFNAELSYRPDRRLRARLAVFRNNVSNLIETRPVAVKHSGQQVFTYFNLSRVYTQGIEASLDVQLLRPLSVQFGYQFLDAADRGVLERIDAGQLFTRVDGRDRRMTREDYGGLMQRSRHQGTLQLVYALEPFGLTAMLSGRLRSRYGFADQNGNGVLDVASEYVDGYGIWNLSLTKDFHRFSLRAGVDNLSNVRPEFVPALSGARWYGGAEVRL